MTGRASANSAPAVSRSPDSAASIAGNTWKTSGPLWMNANPGSTGPPLVLRRHELTRIR